MALPINADVPLLLDRLRSGAKWGWSGGKPNDPSQVVWHDQVQTEPTQTEYENEWTVVESERVISNSQKQSLKAKINALEGIAYSAITNAQIKDLVEVIIFIFDGLNNDETLKSADEWKRAINFFKKQ